MNDETNVPKPRETPSRVSGEVKRLEREERKLWASIDTDPGVIAAREALANARAAAEAKVKPQIEAIWAKLNNRRALIARLKTAAEVEVPAEVKALFDELRVGVDWSARWRWNWGSPDGRFHVISLPGRKYWSGRAQAYANPDYFLIDLTKWEKGKARGWGGTQLLREVQVATKKGGRGQTRIIEELIELIP